jgi:hypothetical protein
MSAKAAKKIRFDPGAGERDKNTNLDRDEELSGKEDIRDALLDLYKDIEKGFDEQADRSDGNLDYWDCYNCVLGDKQFYQGNSKIFIPIILNAVNARKTRFVNQMFPQSGRYVEVTTENGDLPQAEMALLEHYVRRAKLRTQVAPALMKNGDIEGQYTVQVTWQSRTRHVVHRVKRAPEIEGLALSTGEEEDEIEDIEEEVIKDSGPGVLVIADSDLLVLPATSNSLEEALHEGGSVTTLCRWTTAKLKKMIKEKHIEKKAGEAMVDEMRKEGRSKPIDKPKEMVDAAGIKGDGRGKYALVYRTWTMLTLDGERRLCLVYFGGQDKILGCKRNPYWSDRIDIISAPVEKVEGAFKGQSKIRLGVADLQYQANDAANEGMDSAAYALMPIVLTDPEKNPNVGSMIMTLAAIWETSPGDTKFAQFPALWKDALEIVATAQAMIFQTLSVNPAQITNAQGAKKKPSQAEIANEQQVDILTTADAVTVIEEEILSPMLGFMLELDHQYRDKPLLVREYGETGLRANMQEIEPVSMGRAYQFRWYGVEAARNAQHMQQQIAGINVLRGVPPQMYKGYVLDLGPVLAQMIENMFGPRLAPLTFRDMRMEQSVDPQTENQLLGQGMLVPVHAMDDIQKHMQAHMQAMQMTGDPHGVIKVHLAAHMQMQQQQQMEHQQAMQPQPRPGPGGGQPKPGAQPGQVRNAQQPPGAMHQDQLHTGMPR